MELGETDVQAVIREVREETAIELVEFKLKYLGLLPIEYDSFIVDFPIFFTEFDNKPDLTLSPREHIDFQWIKPIDILEIPDIMKGVDVIVKDFCIGKLRMNNPG